MKEEASVLSAKQRVEISCVIRLQTTLLAL